MKFVCNGLDLCDAILKVSKAVGIKTTNPVLEGVKITAREDTVSFFATDLELSIEKKIKADVRIEGEAVVPGKYFADFVRKLDKEQVEITLNDKKQLKISYMDSEGFLQCLNSEEYPLIERVDTGKYFSLQQKEFKDLIAKTVFSAATEDSRPILKGVLLDIKETQMTAVALDGYRLSLVKKQVETSSGDGRLIVPARTLSEIAKLLNEPEESVTVHLQKNSVMIEVDGTTIISRLLEGEFIRYEQIIPGEFTSQITVQREQFENGLERAAILSKNDKNNLVKFDVKEKVLTLVSNSEIGNIKENIPVSLHGKDLLIAFNARYFSEALKNTNEEFVRMNFTSAVSPCVINPVEGDEFLFLILPVRIVG